MPFASTAALALGSGSGEVSERRPPSRSSSDGRLGGVAAKGAQVAFGATTAGSRGFGATATTGSGFFHQHDVHRARAILLASGKSSVGTWGGPEMAWASEMADTFQEDDRLRDLLRSESQEKFRFRLAFSPHGLFARTSPGDMRKSTSTVCKRFHKLMQEQLEPESLAASVMELHPGGTKDNITDQGRVSQPRVALTVKDNQVAVKHSAKSFQASQNLVLLELQREKAMFDIWQALRLRLLGEQPMAVGAERVWPPPKIVTARQEECLRVYKVYCELQEWDERGGPPTTNADGSDDKFLPRPAEQSQSRPRSRLKHSAGTGESDVESGSNEALDVDALAPITWHSFMTWVEHCETYAVDARSKQVYGALKSAVRAVSRSNIQENQQCSRGGHGVDLEMLFRWIWPHCTYENLETMFGYLCGHELGHVRMATPPLITPEIKKEHERLFRAMDRKGRGCISLADFETDDWAAKDAIGDEDLHLPNFMELVCEDSFRGHAEARRAVLQDGRSVELYFSEALQSDVWTLVITPKSEERIWRRVHALEEEVIGYRRRTQELRKLVQG